ncbi:MAG: S-adenosylmethionine:tRNA ribosyltransferase-isomerase, partial [Epsilonproteobacteria bacterium]|nr:S-adenosylmethionine:tRNA ribosyltransferase-isomerase [Campylobacterota bacterium]
MIEPFQVSTYDYFLPEELIASYPKKNRDDARVLIYDRKKDKITHTTFGNIFDFFPSNTAVIVNDTKVVKARVFGKKQSGGKVELLLNSPLQDNLYSVYIKGRVKKNTKLQFDDDLNANIKELKIDGSRIVEFFQNKKKIDTNELFDIL